LRRLRSRAHGHTNGCRRLPSNKPDIEHLLFSKALEAIVYTLHGATVHGVDFWRLPKDPKKRAQRPGFVRQTSSCITD
jgi:hypothetical protein